MNKYQIALNEISSAVLDVYADGYNQPRTAQECYCSSFETLQELVDKADPLEWIPVSERLPEEHDSIFAKLYGTDKWNDALWRTKSKEVLVTIEYEDGTRTVKSSRTTDGKWSIEKKTTLSKFKVVAWMEMPEPYKEKKMNKYKEAIKVVDTVLHHMCGEEKEDGYLPTMEEMSKSMDLLKDLANKADAFNELKYSNHRFTLEEYRESRIGKECANRPLEDILYAVTSIYEDEFMYASKDLERVKNNLKEWLDADVPEERWNEEYRKMAMSIYEFKRRQDLFEYFLGSIEWIKNQYEVVKRR